MVKNFPIILVLILTFISILPLLKSGLPPTHDGEYHVVRFYEFYRALADGSLYPRWAPDLNLGFGVPLFNFVYPLPNYIASVLHFIGFSFIESFKLNMILASFVGAIFMYLWSKEFFGKWGGVVSAVFYTFSPYHFLDIYIRGSVGEVWTLGLSPAFLWSITKFAKERNRKIAVLSSIFLALIIFSHNILALMFFPFAISYIAFLVLREKKRKYLLLHTLYLIFLSLGLSSIFWLPALFEKQYVSGLEVFSYSFHFPEFSELIIPTWGSGFSGGSLSDQLSFQLGIANLVVVFLSLIVTWVKRKDSEKLRLNIFFLSWFTLILFLMLRMSLPIWQHVPFMNYFQFPWRFLSLEILIISFLAGSVVFLWKNLFFVIALVTLSFSLGIGYTRVAYYHQRTDAYYIQRSNFIDGTNSPGNAFNTIWFNGVTERTESKLSIPRDEILEEKVKNIEYKFIVDLKEDRKIIVNTAYFPGWNVYIDGKRTETWITDKGLFSFNLEEGSHNIEVKFEDTTIRKIATVLTFVSIFVILLRLGFFATIKR